MEVRLSSGVVLRVQGAPPLKRAAVLAAHPIPDPPLLKLKRADGGYDLWPNERDPGYLADLAIAYRAREAALWDFYCIECLPETRPPDDDDWRDGLRWLGVPLRSGPQGRKLDYVEFELCQTQADVETLRAGFRQANDGSPEDRAAAEEFFGLEWDGTPVRKAAEKLKKGRLSFKPGWAQFKAAEISRLLPFQAVELPEDLRARLPLLYYDLPPGLRARLEVFYELDILATALQMDEAYRKR